MDPQKRPYRMTTWKNGDGTGKAIDRYYTTLSAAKWAANRIRATGRVAFAEHIDAKAPILHWRS